MMHNLFRKLIGKKPVYRVKGNSYKKFSNPFGIYWVNQYGHVIIEYEVDLIGKVLS